MDRVGYVSAYLYRDRDVYIYTWERERSSIAFADALVESWIANATSRTQTSIIGDPSIAAAELIPTSASHLFFSIVSWISFYSAKKYQNGSYFFPVITI